MSNKPSQEEIDLVESGCAISYAEARRIIYKRTAQARVGREAAQMIEYIPPSALSKELVAREKENEEGS